MPNCVVNNGTYNVMQLETKPDAVSLVLEMYGTQNVHIRLADYKPHSVKNLSRDLTINFWNWNEQEALCDKCDGRRYSGRAGRDYSADSDQWSIIYGIKFKL